MQHPASIPVSLASLSLIQENTSNLTWTIGHFFEQTGSIADQLATVRKLYEVTNIPNRIPDGDQPFPDNAQKVKTGISVEFKCVRLGFRNHACVSTDKYSETYPTSTQDQQIMLCKMSHSSCIRDSFVLFHLSSQASDFAHGISRSSWVQTDPARVQSSNSWFDYTTRSKARS